MEVNEDKNNLVIKEKIYQIIPPDHKFKINPDAKLRQISICDDPNHNPFLFCWCWGCCKKHTELSDYQTKTYLPRLKNNYITHYYFKSGFVILLLNKGRTKIHIEEDLLPQLIELFSSEPESTEEVTNIAFLKHINSKIN
jgi:hypothetical protein